MARMALNFAALTDKAKRWLSPFQPLMDAVQLWLSADGLRMSAAMSFYGMLSMAPLLLLVVGVLGWWLDRSYVESTLIGHIQSVVGERAAQVMQGAMSSAKNSSEGWFASIVALVTLLSGATGVFVELQTSLEKIWRYGTAPEPDDRAAWWSVAISRLRGLSYVMGLGFLLLVSMVLSTVIQIVTKWAGNQFQFQGMGAMISVVNEVVSFLVEVLLFLGLMRFGSGPKPSLRYLLTGAVMGAALFTLGKQGMAFYLSTAAVVSAYGAAGSLVVLLMWIYFTAAILLFSAALAKALSDGKVSLRGSQEKERSVAQVASRAQVQEAERLRHLQALPQDAGENI